MPHTGKTPVNKAIKVWCDEGRPTPWIHLFCNKHIQHLLINPPDYMCLILLTNIILASLFYWIIFHHQVCLLSTSAWELVLREARKNWDENCLLTETATKSNRIGSPLWALLALSARYRISKIARTTLAFHFDGDKIILALCTLIMSLPIRKRMWTREKKILEPDRTIWKV